MENIKLSIHIENKNPLNLLDLSSGLLNYAKLYSNFTKENGEAKLYVQEIKKGSIIIDLVTNLSYAIVPVFQDSNNIVHFVNLSNY